MIPEHAPSSALLLGFGGGTVAQLLHQRYGPLPVTGVDESSAMLEIAKNGFGPALPELTLVEGDAFSFIHQTSQRYGFVAVDLYHGNRLVRGVLALPFLKALAARLEPGGSVAYNLFRDDLLSERVARIERVFDRVRLTEVAANAVFHGRPHRRQR